MNKIKIFSLNPFYYLFPVTSYKYGTKNFSEGEVKKITFKGADKYPIGKQIIEPAGTEFDYIWRHIGFGYYKCTSKTLE